MLLKESLEFFLRVLPRLGIVGDSRSTPLIHTRDRKSPRRQFRIVESMVGFGIYTIYNCLRLVRLGDVAKYVTL